MILLLFLYYGKVSCLIFLNETYCIGRYAFFASRESQFLGGGGFYADVVLWDAHNFGQTLFHLGDMWIEFRALGAYGGIDVAYMVALCGNQVDGLAQEYLAVDVFELLACIGEVVANVAHVGGSQQGIADGVYEYVGIRVTEQTKRVRNLDSTNPQVAVRNQLVNVISHAYAEPPPTSSLGGGMSCLRFFLRGMYIFHDSIFFQNSPSVRT